MIFLPVVDRELRVAARKRATFWSRIIAAIVTLLFGAGLLILLEVVGGKMMASAAGKFLFGALTWMSLGTALFAGVFFTSDCLSEEKREGTIGFLFLTDLRGYDVVLGKLLATSLRGFYTFFAVMPVLAITLLMGGVTGQEFWRACVALLSALFFSLSVGMFVSSLSREPQKALGGTFLLMVLFCGLGPTVDASLELAHPIGALTSPVFLFLQAVYARPTQFGSALLVNQVIAILLLGVSCWILPRTWQVKGSKRTAAGESWGRWWRFGSIPHRQKLRARLLSLNPVLWLAARERWQGLALWITSALNLTLLVFVFRYNELSMAWGYLSGALNFVVYLIVAADSGRFFVAARRTGLVELVLSTPMTVPEIIRGHWRGLVRIYLIPLLAYSVVLTVGSVVSQQKTYRQFASMTATTTTVTNGVVMVVTNTVSGAPAQAKNSVDRVAPLLPYVSAGMGTLTMLANILALCWFGMWMGMTSKNTNFATLKTFVFVQIVPWFVISFASMIVVALTLIPRFFTGTTSTSVMLWYPFASACVTGLMCLAKDAAFVVWSRGRLFKTFRNHATQTVMPIYTMVPPKIGTPPPLVKA